jgi:peptidoglycan-N-acetylglucosamine deacetylase
MHRYSLQRPDPDSIDSTPKKNGGNSRYYLGLDEQLDRQDGCWTTYCHCHKLTAPGARRLDLLVTGGGADADRAARAGAGPPSRCWVGGWRRCWSSVGPERARAATDEAASGQPEGRGPAGAAAWAPPVTRVGAAAGVVAAGVLAAQAGPALVALERWRPLAPARLAGRGDPGHVALTFDDGPVAASTPAVLAALDRLGWRATFFMLGQEVRRAPGLAAEVAAAGHEVAVHGDDHASLLRRGPRATLEGLRRARETVAAATGHEPAWFRPPYGVLTGAALAAAARLGLWPVLWTAWGRDWRAEATAASIVADLSVGRLAGGTMLLHDYAAAGSWRATVAALPRLAELLDRRRLVAGPLAEHGLPAGRRTAGRRPVSESAGAADY